MSEEARLSDDKAVEVEVEQAEDIKALKQALEEQKEKAERYLANWQRTQADFDNYKKRAGQESKEMIEFANSTLILNLLPIMDDLERAFSSLPSQLVEFSWIEGIKLIYNKLKATLEAQGLAEIKAKGELFDPHLHEAVMHREGEEGVVMEEIQKGYKFKDRILRPTLVIVGKGKEEEEEELAIGKEE
ncbi:MAG TPA: nucleotide exchange factor GrpE [Dehalococcoidia bacterium]|nr:nucleotide exchange factor GrpE [Dehalococcoidia bacterium]